MYGDGGYPYGCLDGEASAGEECALNDLCGGMKWKQYFPADDDESKGDRLERCDPEACKKHTCTAFCGDPGDTAQSTDRGKCLGTRGCAVKEDTAGFTCYCKMAIKWDKYSAAIWHEETTDTLVLALRGTDSGGSDVASDLNFVGIDIATGDYKNSESMGKNKDKPIDNAFPSLVGQDIEVHRGFLYVAPPLPPFRCVSWACCVCACTCMSVCIRACACKGGGGPLVEGRHHRGRAQRVRGGAAAPQVLFPRQSTAQVQDAGADRANKAGGWSEHQLHADAQTRH